MPRGSQFTVYYDPGYQGARDFQGRLAAAIDLPRGHMHQPIGLDQLQVGRFLSRRSHPADNYQIPESSGFVHLDVVRAGTDAFAVVDVDQDV